MQIQQPDVAVSACCKGVSRMSKGIKMLSAVDAHGMLHTVDGLQCRYDNEQAIPGLFCDSPNCGRDLHHHLLELRIAVQPH